MGAPFVEYEVKLDGVTPLRLFIKHEYGKRTAKKLHVLIQTCIDAVTTGERAQSPHEILTTQ